MQSKLLKSMTAYGRSTLDSRVGHFNVEIQSVNRRFLEINIALPKQLHRFEIPIRKWVESRVGRGQVSISLFWREEKGQTLTVVPNIAFAKALFQGWEQVAKELNVPFQLSLNELMQEKDILIFHEEIKDDQEEACFEALQQVIHQALDHLVEMKEKEGALLTEDLLKRTDFLEASLHEIQNSSQNACQKYRIKLENRLEELFKGHAENEEKVLREVALFAEKIDITEEIVRFKSHLHQLRHLLTIPLKSPIETRGKTIEFLIQELQREINTIGSKASDVKVAERVISVKSEIEKMREQIQNIE